MLARRLLASSGWAGPLLATRYALLALLVGCASGPPPPKLAVVPAAAIHSICGLLTAEGMTSEIRAVNVTQPLISPAMLQALAQAAFYGGRSSGSAAEAGNVRVPVEVPTGSCIARSIDSLHPSRDRDVMVLQFSAPLANPFERGQLGVVLRLSLGDEAPTWYWVPLSNRAGKWTAGLPSSLAVRQ